MQKYSFNTGVHISTNPNRFGEYQHFDGVGQKYINFYCENVPENAVFKFAADSPDLETENLKKFEIIKGGLLSKYAYFQINK